MLLGYARVSKSDDTQDTAAQVSALKSAGCKRVFEDKASGGRWDRPELHRLLDQLVRERTRAGLKAAAARGRKGGRQPKLTPEQKAEILDGLGSGRKSAADLARLFRVHRATISRLAAQMRVVAPGKGLA